MDSSPLLNAHIEFLDTQLALIHIPLDLYSAFVQPILQLLLLPSSDSIDPSEKPWSIPHASGQTPVSPISNGFVNISVTPIECSIVCSRATANQLFLPIQSALSSPQREAVSITIDDYVVMRVDGEGAEAGQRVLELTSPLAMAGISIFFVTTYFSDYILVPAKCRRKVISALEAQGFGFESFNNTTSLTHRTTASQLAIEFGDINFGPATPGTPPPATIAELQSRTFATLQKCNVVPFLDHSLRLVQCAARRTEGSYGSRNSPNGPLDSNLHLALIKCFITTPKFISITLTATEPPSILLEQRLLPNFLIPSSTSTPSMHQMESLLLGALTDPLNPVILDLRDLPLESTGIVCGVAGRLVGGTSRSGLRKEAVEMSYLSTALAGTVMVAEENAERTVEALKGWGSAEMEGHGGFQFSPLSSEAVDIPGAVKEW